MSRTIYLDFIWIVWGFLSPLHPCIPEPPITHQTTSHFLQLSPNFTGHIHQPEVTTNSLYGAGFTNSPRDLVYEISGITSLRTHDLQDYVFNVSFSFHLSSSFNFLPNSTKTPTTNLWTYGSVSCRTTSFLASRCASFIVYLTLHPVFCLSDQK